MKRRQKAEGRRQKAEPEQQRCIARWWVGAWMIVLSWVFSTLAARADDLAGHYAVAVSTGENAAAPVASPAPAPTPALPEVYGGTLDIAPKRRGYAVTWHPADGTRRRRGIGLRDGAGALGVSLATGGSAYGVQIFHRSENGREWRGPWITSIDGAAGVGEIRFSTDGPLVGRHPLSSQRPGAGSFEGAVEITARGDDYTLTYYLDHSLLYRGLGVLLDDNRLVVGWSFGSPPAVAVYRAGLDGFFAGRRLASRGGPTAVRERFAREGSAAAGKLPAAASGGSVAAGAGGDDLPQPTFGALTEAESRLLQMMEPGAPSVKAWDFDELQRRYGQDGWADRWLAEQLAPDENTLLQKAVKRRERARAKAAKTGKPLADDKRTVGELIESERQRAQALDDD